MLTSKRSAQAEGCGVKERSSRTRILTLSRIRTAHSDWKAAGSQPRLRCLTHRPNALRLLGVHQHIARFAVTALVATLI